MEMNYLEEEIFFYVLVKVVILLIVFKVFKIMLLIFVMLVLVVGNFIVIYVVYVDIWMRIVINVLIVSQSVVDLGISVLVIFFVLVFVGCDGWIFGVEFCIVNGFFNLYFMQIIVLQLVIIVFDRYLVIVKFLYCVINLKDVIKLILVVWIVSFFGLFLWFFLLINYV